MATADKAPASTDTVRIRLNEAAIEALPVPASGSRVHYFAGATVQGRAVPAGFGVRVTTAGVRSFVLNYRVRGRERRLTIGQWPTWTVPAAAAEARRLRQRVDRGEDPLAAKQDVAADKTLGAVATLFMRETDGKLALVSSRKRRRLFERWITPRFGATVQVQDISRSDVVRFIRHVRDSPAGGPGVARSALACLSSLFKWWALHGHDDAFRTPTVPGLAPAVKARERILTDDEIRMLHRALDMKDPCDRLIWFLLSSGLRRSEAALATRGEIAFVRKGEFSGFVLEIPAPRMKGRRPHAVPIISSIVPIGAPTAAERNERLFPGTLSFSRLKARLDARPADMAPGSWIEHRETHMKIEIEFHDRRDLRNRVRRLLGLEEALEMVREIFRPAGYVVNVVEVSASWNDAAPGKGEHGGVGTA